ncbi:hypothetical protein FA13DRAFT_1790566 [Coprinellus micaceus]|uniref:Uncharacterized protein n=1 Tax=Coprinellus micaceus TaxID=71717 RepID=A0A4Y7TH40_COPMI|nr:hypothetical protein FA13DRAFT_1790566 [Coprinellus micaceus]
MVNLGAINLGNLNLHATYTFGQSCTTRSASLTLDVTLGADILHGTVKFDSGARAPDLYFGFTGTLDLSDLFHAILPNDCPGKLPELSLSNLAFTYRWNPTSFTATTLADLIGTKSDALIKLNASGSGCTSKGIFASGQVLGAIDLTVASLYATGNTTNGSLITHGSTQPGSQALAFDAGLMILPYVEDHLCIVGKRQATLPPGRS